MSFDGFWRVKIGLFDGDRLEAWSDDRCDDGERDRF